MFGTGKDHPGRLGEPVTLRGLHISTGDLVIADADGVIVLPAAQAAVVIRRADQRVDREQQIVTELRAGQTTLQLY